MATMLYKTLAAGLLCGAVAFAGPTFAATHAKSAVMTHHMKHPLKHTVLLRSSKLSEVDSMERQITAQLNREALTKATGPEATVIIPNTVASVDDEHGD